MSWSKTVAVAIGQGKTSGQQELSLLPDLLASSLLVPVRLSKAGFAWGIWVRNKACKFRDDPRQLCHNPARRLSLSLLRLLEGMDKALVVPQDVAGAGVEPAPQRSAQFLIVGKDGAGVVELI